MSLKKTDLYKNLRMKVQGQMQKAPVPDRFAGAGEKLVQFGAKLPQGLVKQLQAQAMIRGVTVSELAARLLDTALGAAPLPVLDAVAPANAAVVLAPVAPQAPVKPAGAKKAAAKKVPAKKAVTQSAPVKKLAVKQVAAPKAAAKKPPTRKPSA